MANKSSTGLKSRTAQPVKGPVGEEMDTRRAQIIEIASRVFGERGYKAASLDEVAKELNITRPAIYHHFESKEEILCEIFEQHVQTLHTNVAGIVSLDLPPDEKLRRIILYQVGIVLKRRQRVAVFFHENAQLPEKYFRRLRQKRRNFEKLIEGVIQEGIEKGVFRDINATLATYAILGMCNWAYQWYNPEGPMGPEEIGQTFADFISQGYLAK